MRLVACPSCRAQYDVSALDDNHLDCACGESIEIGELESKDLEIHRCSSCGAHVEIGADGCEYCGSPIVRDPRLLSVICAQCCARHGSDSRFCGSCGVAFDPQSLEPAGEARRCPCCASRMAAREVGGIGIVE
jgi:hypothetical protein